MSEQTVYFQLTAASPLHIGCDELYEPTSFVVDGQARELISFETASFLELLDSDALGEFSAICCKGTIVSLLELLKFMKKHAALAEGHRVEVSPAFLTHYEQTLNLPLQEKLVQQELNNFQIMRTTFDPLTGLSYIPGSAIKGAIRTAVLNHRERLKPQPPAHYDERNWKTAERQASKEAKNLEKRLTGGSFETDPFRLLKVSDFFPVAEPRRSINYAVNRKKKPSNFEPRGSYQILETVAAGTNFVGSISLLPSPGQEQIRQPVTWEEIIKALNFFYGEEKKREDRELASMGVTSAALDVSGGFCPLRLGRHSGAECVSVAGHRRIKIMQARGTDPKFADHATTVWLAATEKKPGSNQSLNPMGWAVLEQLATTEAGELRSRAAAVRVAPLVALRQKAVERKRQQEELAAAEANRRREEAEAKDRREAEEAARLRADEEERAALAAMSEGRRCAFMIGRTAVTENEIVAIFQRVDEFTGEEQREVAAAMKQYWQKNGKWKVKPKQKKQWEKVQKVKKILGDD